MVLVTFLSLYSIPSIDIPAFEVPNLDKAVHFIFYFVASILGCLFVRERTNGQVGIHRTMVIVGLGLIIYGIIIEILQSTLTSYRDGNIYDGMANTAGTLIGLMFINYLFSGKKELKW